MNIDFNGSVQIDNEKVIFVNVENDNEITGSVYKELNDKSMYVLKSFVDCINLGNVQFEMLDMS